eukprot:403353148
MAESNNYKVHYFAGYGKAEAIRMLLTHAKANWEDVNYDHPFPAEVKESGMLEFGQMPVVELNGKFYSQSQATLRALGKIHGYYPEDAYEAYKVDSILDYINDFTSARFKANNHPEPETKKTMLEEFYAKTLPDFFTRIQKRLESNTSQDFISGDKLTIADFGLAALASAFFLNEQNASKKEYQEVLNQFPKVLEYFNKQFEHVKDRLETRKPSGW